MNADRPFRPGADRRRRRADDHAGPALPGAGRGRCGSALTDARADRAVVRHDHRAGAARGRRRASRSTSAAGWSAARCSRAARRPTALAYTWWSGDDDPGLVRIRLEPIGEAETRLTVQHDRLRPHRMIQYGGGWEQNLVALAARRRRRRREPACRGAVARPAVGAAAGAPAAARARRSTHRSRAVWDAWSSAEALAALVVDPLGRRDDRRRRPARRRVPDRGVPARDRGLGGVPRRRAASAGSPSPGSGRTTTARRRDEAVDVTFRETPTRHRRWSVRHTGPWDTDAPGRVLPAGVGVRARGARPAGSRPTARPHGERRGPRELDLTGYGSRSPLRRPARRHRPDRRGATRGIGGRAHRRGSAARASEEPRSRRLGLQRRAQARQGRRREPA